MEIFFTLFIKLLPLYIIILIGYISGKFLNVKNDFISSLLLYVLIPIVIFNTTAMTPLSFSTLSIPILFFLICGLASFITYKATEYLWKDLSKNLLAFITGTANTGYLGFALVVSLFGTSQLYIAVLAVLGTGLYFNTIGFLLAAKSKHSIKESLIKLIKLPMLYAFFFGIAASVVGIHFEKTYIAIANGFNQAYIFLGMMTIGLALAEIKSYALDLKFIGVSLAAKFILWPLLMITILFIDSVSLHIFNRDLYQVLMIMSLLPVAVNLVPYTIYLKENPDKAAVVVVISTIVSLFIIPLIAGFL